MEIGIILNGLGVLGVIVFVHELGHYLAARMTGIGVEVFSVGFGKAIFEKIDSKGTKWKIGIMPLGGFVKFKESESTKSDALGLFFNDAGFLKGSFIAFAGPLFNFICAFICFLIVAIFFGIEAPTNSVFSVAKDSPAQIAGILKNDIITSINNQKIESWHDITKNNAGANPIIQVIRNEKLIKLHIKKNEGQLFGITPRIAREKSSYLESLNHAYKQLFSVTYKMIVSLKSIISPQNFMGPLGIAKTANQAQKEGISELIAFVAVLSIGIAVFNLIPIPLLDGGRILMFAISSIIKRPIPIMFENVLNYGSLAVLGTIFILSFATDIRGIL